MHITQSNCDMLPSMPVSLGLVILVYALLLGSHLAAFLFPFGERFVPSLLPNSFSEK